MFAYIIRRIIHLILLLIVISVIFFLIIQLAPGDFLTVHIMQLRAAGTQVAEAEIAILKHQYGLDKPIYVQYFMWIVTSSPPTRGGASSGNFGDYIALRLAWNPKLTKEEIVDEVSGLLTSDKEKSSLIEDIWGPVLILPELYRISKGCLTEKERSDLENEIYQKVAKIRIFHPCTTDQSWINRAQAILKARIDWWTKEGLFEKTPAWEFTEEKTSTWDE